MAKAILARSEAEYSDVVRPFLDSEDIAETVDQAPTRSIIDFASMTLGEAMRYPAALEIVEATVRPVRKDARRKAHRERWWLLAEPRKGLRVAVAALPRHRAVERHGKRALFSWVESRWFASDATVVFAFDDDYSFGILTGRGRSPRPSRATSGTRPPLSSRRSCGRIRSLTFSATRWPSRRGGS